MECGDKSDKSPHSKRAVTRAVCLGSAGWENRKAAGITKARRPAGFVARSSHTTPRIAWRSRLASGPGQPAAKCEFISARAL